MTFSGFLAKVTGIAATKTFKTMSKGVRGVTDVAAKEPVKDLGSLPSSVLEAASAAAAGMSLASGGSSVAPGGKSKGGSKGLC